MKKNIVALTLSCISLIFISACEKQNALEEIKKNYQTPPVTLLERGYRQQLEGNSLH